jgi:hypothetical protein
MTQVRTAAKVGSIYYDMDTGEGFVVLNERWYVIFSDNIEEEINVILDVRRDMDDFYKQVHDELD